MSWTVEGKTCLVTGATSGIGEMTALGLARQGARVLLVGRDGDRGKAACERVARQAGGASVELLLADLASQAQIRRLAAEVLDRCPAIHLLVNNAGVVNLKRTTTEDGLETTFAVNHLAYFLLTRLLLDRIRASAPARIVNVASDAYKFGTLDFEDLQSERRYRSMQVYGSSKLANVHFTRELARRLEGTDVTVNCLHPGAVATRLGQNNGWLGRLATGLMKPFFRTPEQGAATTLFAATSPELDGVSGDYLANSRRSSTSRSAEDASVAARLWTESSRLTGLEE